jgi:hypothetical protein
MQQPQKSPVLGPVMLCPRPDIVGSSFGLTEDLTMTPMTPAQQRAIEEAALALHAALHAVDESVSYEFAWTLGLIDAPLGLGTSDDSGQAIFNRLAEVFRR